MLRKWKAATTRRSAPEAYCAAENKKGACTDGILQHGTRNLRMLHEQPKLHHEWQNIKIGKQKQSTARTHAGGEEKRERPTYEIQSMARTHAGGEEKRARPT